MHLRKAVIIGALALVALAPAPARADWLFTPFIGPNFGGETVEQKLNYGASLDYMGAGVFGFEVDFGYSPEFFEPADDDLDLIDTSNVTTLMANVIIGAPVGGQLGPGVRPYVTGGIGLIRSHVQDPANLFDVDNNDFGVNIGAGVMGFFNDNVGLRGDLRYFRSLSDPEEDNEFDIDFGSFDFWRGTVGVVFRFGQ